MLRDSVVVAVMRTRPRAIPLVMITMKKLTHGFPFLSYMSMGLHLAARRNSAINRVYVRGSKYVLGRTQTHFSPTP